MPQPANMPQMIGLIILSLSSLIGLVKLEIDDVRLRRKPSDYDKALFNKFLVDFSSTKEDDISPVSLLNEISMRPEILFDQLIDLMKFERVWRDSEHIFNDKHLNKMKDSLITSVKIFLDFLHKNYNTRKDPLVYYLKSPDTTKESWEDYDKRTDKLDDQRTRYAYNILRERDNLIAEAQKRLF